jgi:hypothetical protein
VVIDYQSITSLLVGLNREIKREREDMLLIYKIKFLKFIIAEREREHSEVLKTVLTEKGK